MVAHAEAVKENTKLKEELARAQTKARESENAAEVATVKATNAESNWTSQRDALKKELEEVSARCMDLVAHNATLHQHLESVSTQAARIRQAAEAPQTELATSDSAAADGEDASAELRGVITFVRREKEIAELQLDLHKQENIRLKAYSDRLSQTLEDARKLLSEVFESEFVHGLHLCKFNRSASELHDPSCLPISMLSFWGKLNNLTSFAKATQLSAWTAHQTLRLRRTSRRNLPLPIANWIL